MAISHSSSLEGLVFPEKSPVRPETMTSSRPPSRGTLSTLVPIAPSANDSDIEASPANGSDIEAPLGKETIRIIARLDAKEKEAAQKYIDQVKTKRYEAKQRELKKQWRWRWRSDHSFLNKMAEVKRLIELEAGNPTSPMTYEEIKRLLFIEKHSIYAKALGEWSRKEVLFTDRMERKKTMVASVKNETFQLIGWFVAFQSFLFTGVAGSNLLHCNNKWYPIFLSMLASFVTVAGIVLKMIRIKEIQTTTQKRDERPLEEIRQKLEALRRNGIENFEFAMLEDSRNSADRKSKAEWFIYFAVILCLLSFSAGFPVAFWRILCYSGSNPYAAPVPSSN